MSTSKNLVDIWDIYSKTVLNEKAPAQKATKFGKKEGPGAVDRNDIKKAQQIANKDTSGPSAAEGVNTNIVDIKNPKHKNNPILAGLTFGEKFDKNIEKTSNAKINNYMKSIFDKLFEEVMDGNDAADLNALGVGADAKSEGMDDASNGDTDEGHKVTLTADQVECLKAILAQIEGSDTESEADGDESFEIGGEEDAEGHTEEDAEEHADDDKEMKEATEMKEVPDSAGAHLQKHSSIKVGDKTSKLAKSGKADGKVTSEVDGKGKDLADSAGLGLTKHSANKPHSKIKGNNQEFFGV